jgi:hypothetical protein
MATAGWIVITIAAIILLYILVRIAISLIKTNTTVVRQGQAAIITRSGRFNRVVDPGTRMLINNLEKIDRIIDTRNRLLDVSISDILAYGVSYEMALSFWCSFEPQKLFNGDQTRLAQLVGIRESERQNQIEAKLRDMLENQIAILQSHMPIPDKSADRINALTFGSDRYNALKKRIITSSELKNTLASLGFILDTTQPILFTTQNQANDSDTPGPSVGLLSDEPRLTKHDLAILKRIPRASN